MALLALAVIILGLTREPTAVWRKPWPCSASSATRSISVRPR